MSHTHLGFDYPIRPRIPKVTRRQDFFDVFQYKLADHIKKYHIANHDYS